MGKQADEILEKLEEFKKTVRSTAIRVQGEQGWNDDDLNATLRELGLPEKRRFHITVTALTRQTGIVPVDDAESEAEARELLRRDPSRTRLHFAGTVTSVEVPEPEPAPEPVTGGAVAVGDHVRVVDVGRWGGAESLNGLTGTIRSISDDGEFRVRVDEGSHSWSERVITAETVELVTDVSAPPTGAPRVGDPTPAYGMWYARSRESGGPNQCRVWNPVHSYYCTRPIHHEASPHVASGATAGVLAVWEKTDSDERGDEFMRGDALTGGITF